jgi:hypothetical protein
VITVYINNSKYLNTKYSFSELRGYYWTDPNETDYDYWQWNMAGSCIPCNEFSGWMRGWNDTELLPIVGYAEGSERAAAAESLCAATSLLKGVYVWSEAHTTAAFLLRMATEGLGPERISKCWQNGKLLCWLRSSMLKFRSVAVFLSRNEGKILTYTI